ncbi:hypothetical protein TCAL_02479 [Tigriopus californicus]|uniref:Cytochrome b5 heme-binding domain-containing protein n=1 Tax=Tigriopus californicus TaxID=6832 RepID=A0A553NT89_TIGCA|nr:cytochrome b5-related protein-like [Tigriopus californicus]TRY68651.1 hypothetical protein TCAL_02479 [Tigriopus californicus]|eukprot:TCALIF_02479-PA protein Name:"Similar to Cyt-b5-r Cytochrome b5-related protein (Drosophila melanogaster)" AED:0.03 eAED:0.03 QI:0/-1/0/1/-1/1/1/0/440
MAPKASALVEGTLTSEALQEIAQVAHVDQWIEFKKKYDDIGDSRLWRIHNDLYDLSDFIDKHPGGSMWIAETRGTDITEAFEVAHVFGDNFGKILTKYHVRSVENSPRKSPFTFKSDGFYQTLKRRVQKILKEVGTGPSHQMLLIQDGLFFSYVTLLLLTAWLGGPWILVVATGLILGMTCSCAHNFFHQRDNYRMYLGDLSASHSRDWRISHMLCHHLFTNSAIDVESSVFLPFINWFVVPDKTWTQLHLFPMLYPLMYLLTFPVNLVQRPFFVLKGETPFRLEYVLPYVPLLVFLSFGLSLVSTILVWFTMHGIAGFWIVFTSLIGTHHHPSVFHDGDYLPKDLDWGISQIDTTRDVNKSGNLFLIATSFGDHLLHHLFPTVDHSKLDYLIPALNETLTEFAIEYPVANQWNMVLGMHSQMTRTKPNTHMERRQMRIG